MHATTPDDVIYDQPDAIYDLPHQFLITQKIRSIQLNATLANIGPIKGPLRKKSLSSIRIKKLIYALLIPKKC